MFISFISVEAYDSLNKQCEKLVHSNMHHFQVLKEWKNFMSSYKHPGSATNTCQRKNSCNCKGDVLFSADDDLYIDPSFLGNDTEDGIFNDFGTVLFHDSSMIGISCKCQESRFYKSTPTKQVYNDTIISITGTFCEGVLEWLIWSYLQHRAAHHRQLLLRRSRWICDWI